MNQELVELLRIDTIWFHHIFVIVVFIQQLEVISVESNVLHTNPVIIRLVDPLNTHACPNSPAT
jgi:hypothetical protein